MSQTPARHRWILAVPAVLAVVGLTLREGMDRPVDPLDTAAVSDVWSAGYVAPDPGAVFAATDNALDLRAGGVLAYAPGIAVVRANGWEASVWGGALYVSAERGGMTVAALDVPVVVRGTLGTAVVRPRTQWRSPSVPYPDPSLDPVAWDESIRLIPLPEHFVRDREDIVANWKTQLPPVSTRLSASDLREGDAARIARLAPLAAPSRALAAAIRARRELRFHALLQPLVRDMAWAYVPDTATVDASTWMSLMLLPRLPSDDSSALTARKWGETLARAVASSSSASSLRSALLPRFEADILAIARDGHPLRALQFADAARVALGTGATLAADAEAALERLAAMSPDSLRASVLSEVADAVSSPAPLVQPVAAPESDVPPQDNALEVRAREVLAAKGAMFTSDSSVRAVAAGVVEVQGIVFGFPSGDRVLWFRYAPEADTVQAVIDGAIQPYAVLWQAYIDWESTR